MSVAARDAGVASIDFGSAQVVTRAGGVALRWRRRSLVTGAVLAALTLAVGILSLMIGQYPLSVAQVWAALTGDPEAGFASTVVLEWRLPRAVAAIVFGAALGIAGAIFQSLTRNPLASPDIIGFSTGSYTGALIVIILLGGGYLQVAAGALVGGLATALLVYLVAWQRGVQGFRLIIAGIAFSAMLMSVNVWLLMVSTQEVALSATAWGIGSLNGMIGAQVAGACAVIALLFVAAAVCAPGLRQLELGDDAAKAGGVRVEPLRLSLIVIGVAFTATVTASAGPIAFVALAAPQIARRLVRSPGVALVPAAIMGALMLASADIVAQHLLTPGLPVGVVTVVIGGGYLVWLLVREARGRG
ncbi:FecCD family ABC transporter permease [Microbacterium sp. No. 7]|uniref:FecCD family ABC transporter permease n=1 Tax=Microbacterium sp. No. 7 TaxID=1714373 RepID=UPI0006D282A1|nr:iron chelate uptake ABC transporter family permease subunit [Microbacterium sp. No. 7]ALJ18954.1 iron ABC transporter permease [Microbacterium sp. No. 7]